MKKKLLVPALTLTILAGTIYGVGQASAETGWHDNSPVIQKLVDRFGLDESEVQQVFTEARDEQQLQRQLEFEEYLETAYQNGEITDEQKQAILEKHAEMMAERQNIDREEFQNMSREEKQAQNETRRAEMDSWADENGVDLKYLFGADHLDGMGRKMGPMNGLGK